MMEPCIVEHARYDERTTELKYTIFQTSPICFFAFVFYGLVKTKTRKNN